MSRADSRERVQRARVELEQAERQLDTRWQPWRERLRRHRLKLLVGGGLLGGFAFAALSPARWSRVGAALFGGSAWLARSPIGPVLFGALWTTILGSPSATSRPAAGRSAANGAGSARPDA